MDPVTHITAGAIAGRAIESKFARRGIMVLCIVAAIMPDIDNFVALINPEMYMAYHRSLTHSLAGGLLLALIISFISRRFYPDISLKKTIIICYALILLHVFLDLITSYGTQILYPFSRTRYALSSIFMVDPLYSAVMLILLIFSYISRKRPAAIAVTALIFIFTYPLVNYGIKMYTEKYVNEKLTVEEIKHSGLSLEPELFSPVNWKVIIEDNGNYRMSGLNLLDPKKPFNFDTYKKADINRMLILGEKAGIFRTFVDFAVYPVEYTENQDNLGKVYFSDLRFYGTVPLVKKHFNKKGIPFSLVANIDKDGNLLSWGYYRPVKQNFIEFLK